MKIAILGAGNDAVVAANRFCALGADVIWFSHLAHGEELLQCWGQQTRASDLSTDLDPQIRINECPVRRIQKSHLGRGDQLAGRSRIADTFSVVYMRHPELEDSPVLANYPPELVESLRRPQEYYEEVDLVWDFRWYERSKRGMGAGGPCLGEFELGSRQQERVHYFTAPEQLQSNSTVVAVLGDALLSSDAFVALEEWHWEKPEHTVFYVSAHADPFEQIPERLKILLDRVEQDLDHKKSSFLTAMEQWKQLDPYQQAKTHRPELPVEKLVTFSAHSACAIHGLMDRDQLYLSIEGIPGRDSIVGKHNRIREMKTLAVDEVVVADFGHDDRLVQYQGLRVGVDASGTWGESQDDGLVLFSPNMYGDSVSSSLEFWEAQMLKFFNQVEA